MNRPYDKKPDYKVGQTVWFFHGDHKGKMTEGQIVHEFVLEGETLFVIEYDTGIDPCYEVRNWHAMSPAADQPIGLWLMVRDISAQMRLNKEAAARRLRLSKEAVARQAELDGDYNGE